MPSTHSTDVLPRPTGNSAFSTREVRSIVIGLMLAILLGALDQTIVSVSLPLMAADLHGVGLLAWVVSGYLITVAVVTPIYGKLGDLYGRRVMLSSAIGIFLVASTACALSTSMPMLVSSRILQGVGGGGLISVAQAAISDVVSPRERGLYQGYLSVAFAVASVVGPLAGGLLTEFLSWRWVFWINLPLGAFALLISYRALSRLPVPHIKRPIDYFGALLLIVGVTPLLIAFTRSGQGVPWLEHNNLLLFAMSAVTIAAFIRQEQRTEEPIIPLSILRNPIAALSCLIALLAFLQIISLSVLIPLRLQMLTNAGADGAAFQLIPLSLAIPTGAYVAGRIMVRTGAYKPIQIVGTVITPLSIALMAFVDVQATFLNVVITTVVGLAIGLQLPTSTVAAQNAVPQRHLGIVTAINSFSRSLGAAMGVAILTAVLFAALQAHAPASFAAIPGTDIIRQMVGSVGVPPDTAIRAQLFGTATAAFKDVFLLSTLLAALSIVVGFLVPAKPLSEKVPVADMSDSI
ncbi:MAG: MFS transporter [Burkholderiaceae bacterium]|nr:MAG: MFS transporter [Burkholderiaceae bacterium]TAM05987.1 MAG: MFS transporter [Pusillimonas sp.]